MSECDAIVNFLSGFMAIIVAFLAAIGLGTVISFAAKVISATGMEKT